MYTISQTSLASSKVDKFSLKRYLEWSNVVNMYDPKTSLLLNRIRKLPVSGSYTLKKWRTEGRLDLVSFEVYRTTKLWWVLMHYNDIDRFYNVKLGTVLLYPSYSSIENLIISLTTEEGFWL